MDEVSSISVDATVEQTGRRRDGDGGLSPDFAAPTVTTRAIRGIRTTRFRNTSNTRVEQTLKDQLDQFTFYVITNLI